jgi:hypothetical protein
MQENFWSGFVPLARANPVLKKCTCSHMPLKTSYENLDWKKNGP